MKHKNTEPSPDTADSNPHLDYLERRWEVIAAVTWKEYVAPWASAVPDGEYDCICLPLNPIQCNS